MQAFERIDKHDDGPIANLSEECHHCASNNVIGPFEMDGYADGEYHANGLTWLVCRDCGRSSLVSKS